MALTDVAPAGALVRTYWLTRFPPSCGTGGASLIVDDRAGTALLNPTTSTGGDEPTLRVSPYSDLRLTPLAVTVKRVPGPACWAIDSFGAAAGAAAGSAATSSATSAAGAIRDGAVVVLSMLRLPRSWSSVRHAHRTADRMDRQARRLRHPHIRTGNPTGTCRWAGSAYGVRMLLALIVAFVLLVCVGGYFYNRNGPGDNVRDPNVKKRRNT